MSRWDRASTAAVLALAGGALGLLAGSRPWVHATVTEPLLGVQRTVTASGRVAAPLVVAVALVALAGGVALLLAGRLGRRVVGIVLVLAGAAQVAATISVVREPEPSIADQVARAVGSTGTSGLDVTITGWPWLAVPAGVLVVLAGVLAVLRAHRWSGPQARYQAPVTEAVEPSVEPPPGSTPPPAASGAPRVAGSPHEQPDAQQPDAEQPDAEQPDAEQPGRDDALTWDELSRGEDPTR